MRNDNGDLGRMLAQKSGARTQSTKVDSPEYESKVYPLDTLENCRELLSECLKAVTDGEMPVDIGRFAADVAKKASDTLIKSGNMDQEITGILRELARKQPQETGRGLGVHLHDDGVEIVEH